MAQRPNASPVKLAARLDPDRLIVLTHFDPDCWRIQLWGPESMSTEVRGLTVDEAKEHGHSLVALFLRDQHPGLRLPDHLHWRSIAPHHARGPHRYSDDRPIFTSGASSTSS